MSYGLAWLLVMPERFATRQLNLGITAGGSVALTLGYLGMVWQIDGLFAAVRKPDVPAQVPALPPVPVPTAVPGLLEVHDVHEVPLAPWEPVEEPIPEEPGTTQGEPLEAPTPKPERPKLSKEELFDQMVALVRTREGKREAKGEWRYRGVHASEFKEAFGIPHATLARHLNALCASGRLQRNLMGSGTGYWIPEDKSGKK
jgi:hypothetical protein